MIHTGLTQELVILRNTSAGFFLGDGAGGEVLLPNKYRPAGKGPGASVRVFVYRDSEDRQVATTLEPLIHLGGFAPLRVNATGRVGAFMDWGLEKDLLVPHAEQRGTVEEGRRYVVYMALDEQTDRLYGSMRVERFLDNTELTVQEGSEVQLLVFGHSPLGWSVIVNGRHQGLLHGGEVFRRLAVGDRIPGFVKGIRPDNKLDITLQPPGYAHYNDANVELLSARLAQSGGFLPYTDKTPPEEIHRVFGISKKAFKQAVGALYKARKVTLREDGIAWNNPSKGKVAGKR